jgi:shikimate dehydrogenase
VSDGDRRFVVGLIGADLGPSLSPALHEREADDLGLRYVYQRIDLDVLGLGAEDVGDLVRQARRLGFAGLNITHPCKQTVVKYLDQLSPDATALGAVNTVVFGQRGTIGHNTDWSGFAAGFKRGLADAKVDHVALLGAGGAGTAVAYAIARLGARRLTVVDVVLERAELLESVLSHAFPGSGDDEPIRIEVAHSITEIADSLTSADGLINATPIGMTRPEEAPLPDGFLRPEMWVADVIYRPLETELLRRARETGCRTLNGGGMVVFQAAEAFRLITGEAPDADRMYAHFTSMTRVSPAAQPVGS